MLSNELEVFRGQVRTHFISYYINNDAAHLINHADEVVENAIHICQELHKPGWIPIAIVSGYAHDMFTVYREDHHVRAAHYVVSKEFKELGFLGLSDKDDWKYDWAAQGALSHRASWKGGYHNLFAEIIAVADRGRPDLKKYYLRSYLYAITKQGKGCQEAMYHSLEHIREKFGKNGTAKLPPLYFKFYKDDMKVIREKVETMTVSEMEELIKEDIEELGYV
jgi:hypothetical protein